MDYKETLLLPETNFPMRGNLPQNEPQRLKSWYEERKVYEKMKKNRQNAVKTSTSTTALRMQTDTFTSATR